MTPPRGGKKGYPKLGKRSQVLWFVGYSVIEGRIARRLRLEAEPGIYHVINRGNYRAFIFEQDSTKSAFLKCLEVSRKVNARMRHPDETLSKQVGLTTKHKM
jgi:hypothetical protein